MILDKLLSLYQGRRPRAQAAQRNAAAASRTSSPNHVMSDLARDSLEPSASSQRICRESIQVRQSSPSLRSLMRPGQVAPAEPLCALGRQLAACICVADVLAALSDPTAAAALHRVRRISLTAATGQADASQFATICALLAAKCPNLQQLDVADALLSSAAAQSLATLPALNALALNVHACDTSARRPLPHGVLENLARSPQLHTLLLGNADLPPRGVTPLVRLAPLRSLSLSNCAFYAHDAESIAALQPLESLFYRSEQSCQAVARAATQLLNLETLYLAKYRTGGQAVPIESFASLHHLRRLHVEEAIVSASALRAIGRGCTVMQELRLRDPILVGTPLSGLDGFKRLRTLHIFDGELTSGAELSSSPVLALRKKYGNLTNVLLPGQHLSTSHRHALLSALGPGTLTYGGRWPYKYHHSDVKWLRKKKMIAINEPYPPGFIFRPQRD